MKELNTTIDGNKVESYKENGTLFLSCNGSYIPADHIKNVIRIAQVYENIFEAQDHVIKEKLFDLKASYSEIKGIYDEIYK